jgi:transposase-like protein
MKEERVCPWCQSNSCRKNGLNHGRQRYHCKTCGKRFTGVYQGKALNDVYLIDVLHLYLEGLSSHQIGKVLGVEQSTLSGWLRKYASLLPKPKRRQTARTVKASELSAHLSENGLLNPSNQWWVVSSRGLCLPL